MPNSSLQARRIDLFTGIAFIALSVFLFWASFGIRDFTSIGVGAAFAPRLVAVLFLAVGITMVVGTFSVPATTDEAPDAAPGDAMAPAAFGGLPGVAATVALMFAYGALIEPLGFVASSVIYVFLQTLLLNKSADRPYWLFLLTSLIPVVAVYLLFVHVFGITLPVGSWYE